MLWMNLILLLKIYKGRIQQGNLGGFFNKPQRDLLYELLGWTSEENFGGRNYGFSAGTAGGIFSGIRARFSSRIHGEITGKTNPEINFWESSMQV